MKQRKGRLFCKRNMNAFQIRLIFCVFLLFGFVGYVSAAGGGFGLISPQNLKITDDSLGYDSFDVASNGDNYLVVWNSDTSNPVVKGQFVSKSGSLLGDSFIISDGIGTKPRVESNGDNYFVAWLPFMTMWGPTLKGALVTSQGTVSMPITVDADPGNSFLNEIDVVSDGTNFLVISGWRNVIGQRISSSGTLLGTKFQISPQGNFNYKHSPVAAYDGNKFFIIWMEEIGVFQSGGGQIDYDIYGAEVNTGGVVLNTQIPIYVGPDTTVQREPVISYGADSYLIVWSTIISTASGPKLGGARESRISKDGVFLDPPNGKSLAVDTISESSISFDGSEWVLVGTYGTAYRITSSGLVYDSCQTPHIYIPKIAFDGTNFLVTWVDPHTRIFQAQILTTSNQQPVANAGPDITTYRYTPKILDGTNSYDPEGYYPLQYRWTLVSRPDSWGYLKGVPTTGAIELSTDQTGTYTVQLIVKDYVGTASAPDTVSVTVLNLPHELDPIGNKEVKVNELLQIQLSATNPDGDHISYWYFWESYPPSGWSFDSSTGLFSWTPPTVGTYIITFGVSDNMLIDSEKISIIVKPQNNDPVANPDTASTNKNNPVTITVLSNDNDPDGDTISVTSVTQGSNGIVTFSENNVIYTPNQNYWGSDSFSYTISDGKGGEASASVSITINNVNHAPILDVIGNKVVNEDQQLQFQVSATDPDGGTLTYSTSTLPTGAQFSGSTFTWTPGFDQAGSYPVTFTVSDGTLTDTEAVTITVNNVNRAPELAAIGAKTVNEGVQLQFSVSGSDPDGTPVTFSATNPPMGAQFSGSTFTWTPEFNQAGTYKVIFTVSDGTLIDTEEVTITVSNVNRAPVAEAGSDQLLHIVGSTVTLDGKQSYDEDGDILTYQWTFISKPPGSIATLNGATTATPTFIADKNGEYKVQLVVSDGSTQSTPDIVTCSFLNVKPVADAGASQSVALGETVALDGRGSSDVNGDALTYKWSLVAVPVGSISPIVNPTASQTTFIPDKVGGYTIQLIVNDGFVNSDPSSIQIEVIVKETKIITDIQNLETTITVLPPDLLKNANMQNALINKLNAVIADISAGDYTAALNKLQNDVLAKTDGCATSGSPDKNDWITSCQSQAIIRPKILSIINEIKAL